MRRCGFLPLLTLLAAVGWASVPARGRAEEPIRLREAFPAGYQYHVSTRVDLSGSLALPPEKSGAVPRTLTISGNSAIEYDERVLEPGTAGEVQKTLRIYRQIDFQRKVGDQRQASTIRPAVRRLVVLRLKHAEVPFSPDGPLMWGEIDLVRTDVFTPALVGLLPEKPVRPGEHWTAARAAVQELTDMERIDEGQVECRFEEITALGQRRHARIAFTGIVSGLNEDGPNRQQLDGYLFFDLESQHVSYLSLKGTSFLLDKDGKTRGRVEGQFVLTRQAHGRPRDLSDEALRGVTLEPNAENTLLLYASAEVGVRFLYPRRWRVAGKRGFQVTLDDANGNGLLLTVEPPARVPTGAQFLAESEQFLRTQKVRILRADPPRQVAAAPQGLEHFALQAEINGQQVVLDYYVSRQAAGGVTLAARLLPADLAAVQKEVERIARSVTVTRGR